MSNEATKLLRAAERGDTRAQSELGDLYAEGEGVPQNDAEAAKWYRLAAELGDDYAQQKLGWMYFAGDGVRPGQRRGGEVAASCR
jgi:TPR repeat protein